MNKERYFHINRAGENGVRMVLDATTGVIGNVITLEKDDERVNGLLDDMANGRSAISKVNGYTIFVFPVESLYCNLEQDRMKSALDGIAEYYLAAVVSQKTGRFKRACETGESVRQLTEAEIAEKKRNRAKMNLRVSANEYIDGKFGSSLDDQSRNIVFGAYVAGGMNIYDKIKKKDDDSE